MTYYHYTIEYKAHLILQSGALHPSGGGLHRRIHREKRILWFSKHKVYEPTAIKPMKLDGGLYYPNWDDYFVLFKPYRFKLVSDRYLSPWLTTCQRAKTPSKLRKSMEVIGRKTHAKTSDWFGTLDAVPLSELQIEVFVNNEWVVWSEAEHGLPQPAPEHIQSMTMSEALNDV